MPENDNTAPWGRWSQRHRETWISIGLVVAIAALLVGINIANMPPVASRLRPSRVDVLAFDRANSRRLLTHPSGPYQTLEFPGLMWPQPGLYVGLTPQEEDALTGCSGVVHGTHVRFSAGRRFRIWSLSCGGVELSFDRMKQGFDAEIGWAKQALAIYAAAGAAVLALGLCLSIRTLRLRIAPDARP